jgi:hypothetical protein
MLGLRHEYLNRSSAAIAGLNDVALRQGRAVAELGEEIAAHQGPGRFLEDHTGVPAVRGMGRIEVADPL